ncbi:MAG: (5-formylfuran-3-yl)methyl phosphate synthase [Planctomycetaceae bacterium]
MDEPQTFTMNPPQLLVSIRDASEVAPAIVGGCDIIDIKDPARGSLGRADALVWSSIADEMLRLRSHLPCSVALGEPVEEIPSADSAPLPYDWDFAKLGIAGLGTMADWPRRLADSRKQWERRLPATDRWILVVYADWQLADSPSLTALHEQLPEILATADWDGVLIDTFTKNGRTLLDFVDASQLHALGDLVRRSNKLWCVAGSLRADALADVIQSQPDVVGIRTAGCRDECRDQPIDDDAVRRFRDALYAAHGMTQISTKAQKEKAMRSADSRR